MPIILSTQMHEFTLGRELGRGCYGKVYLSNIPGGHKVVIKVFRKRRDSQIELKIAQDICGSNLKGLAVLEDFGTISNGPLAY